MSINGILSVVFSETSLSLYPQLIRITKLNTSVQIFLRVLTITLVSYYFLENKNIEPNYQQGFLNLIHILSSYYAFETINSGDALALFYTYPIFNLIFSKIILSEKITTKQFITICASVIGAVLISKPSFDIHFDGVFAALIAAITESLMYITYHDRNLKSTVTERIYELYSGTIPFLIVLGIFIFGFKEDILVNFTSKNLIFVILFNTIVGYFGHLLRAYGALNLSAPVFSVFSLFGVIAGYVFQIYFEKVLPTNAILFGAFLILSSSVSILSDL